MVATVALVWSLLSPWGLALPQDEILETLKSELPAQEVDWWGKFSKSMQDGDQRGMEDLVRRQRGSAEIVFSAMEKLYCVNAGGQESQYLSNMDQLGKRLDALEKGKRYQHRIEYIIALKSPKDRQDRLAAIEKMRQGIKIVIQGGEQIEIANVKQARDLMDEARDVFDRVKDVENQAWTRYYIALLENKAGNFLNAAVAMDQGMDYWLQSEMVKGPEYLWMSETRRTLIEKGFDPEKAGKGGGGADTGGGQRNTASSFAKDSAWKETPLKVRLDPKLEKLEKYNTPAFAGDDPYTWWDFTILKDAPGEFLPWFRPFGRTVYVTREGSSYFIDRDGDKKGDEKFALNAKATVVELYKNPADKKSAVYGIALATGSQNETEFGLKLSNVPGQDYALVRYRTGCYLEGNVEGQDLVVIDDNDSGKFGDIVPFTDVIIDPDKSFQVADAMALGPARDAAPFSEFVKVGTTFYRLKITDDYVARSRAMDLDTGKVVMQWSGGTKPESLVILGLGEFLGAAFDIAKAKDGVDVPVGSYQIAYGLITNGKKGASAQKIQILPGTSTPFEVQAGKTHTVEMGAPFRIDFQTKEEGDQFIVVGKSIRIYGKSGECYAKFFDEVPRPTVAIKAEGGGPVNKPEEMKLGGLEEWHKDKAMVFFPLNYSVKKRASDKLVAQLTIKKHKLLTSTMTSEWK